MTDQQRRACFGGLAFFLAGVVAVACGSNEETGATAVGGTCTTSQDCASRHCVSGVCQAAVDGGSGGSTPGGGPDASNADMDASSAGTNPTGSLAGSRCTEPDDCQSGECTGGFCWPSVMLPNTTCSTAPDCASGICMAGECQIPAGASGTVDQTDCEVGTLGCACQPMNKCKPELTCVDGTCCNSRTMSCDPGSSVTDAGLGSSGPPSACTPGVVGPVITDCGYPFASSNPLTDILFNESTVLAAIVPSGGYPYASIQLFYNDEHAMTLGVRETVIDDVSTSFPVSPLTMSPDVADAPETGTNLIIGQKAGVDPVGRPMWPALFVTDITDDANAVAGDWQWGGAPVNPTYVAGTWKSAVRTVGANGAEITPDDDPARNNQDYGNGHTAPAGAITKAEAFGTEVRWNLRLEAGHNYRFQVMVHDGDQNKVGGDAGEACVTFCAGNTCPEVESCASEEQCGVGEDCADGCCIPHQPPPPPASDGGSCPEDWQTFVAAGVATCTPPPKDGACPDGYVITVQNNKQYCTQLTIR